MSTALDGQTDGFAITNVAICIMRCMLTRDKTVNNKIFTIAHLRSSFRFCRDFRSSYIFR